MKVNLYIYIYSRDWWRSNTLLRTDGQQCEELPPSDFSGITISVATLTRISILKKTQEIYLLLLRKFGRETKGEGEEAKNSFKSNAARSS